jgi:hypothetical protein
MVVKNTSPRAKRARPGAGYGLRAFARGAARPIGGIREAKNSREIKDGDPGRT